MPTISVIVPVYNVEHYLPACLDSVLAQTMTDLEVICVDDGSTDKSGAILDHYARKDNRIRVIHKENRGYGHSMNVGMDAAAGEYIAIVESDDCILPEMYERLYNAAQGNGLDFVKSDVIFWWENINYLTSYHVHALDDYYNRVLDESDRRVFFRFYMNTWTGIYKKKFLKENDIRYHETPGASFQDNGFWMQTMSFAKKTMWLGEAFYMYRQDNPASSIKRRDMVMTMANEYDYIARILEQKGKKKELDICHYYRLIRHRGTFIRIADELKRDYCTVVIKDFNKYGELVAQNKFVYEWLQRLCQNPEGVCEEFIENKKVAMEQMQNAKHIIIYGAGIRGKRILRILAHQGMCKKIMCFAVTDQTSITNIGTKPVYCIGELLNHREDSVVVISASEYTGAYRQIKDLLGKLDFQNVLDAYILEQYFYHLEPIKPSDNDFE